MEVLVLILKRKFIFHERARRDHKLNFSDHIKTMETLSLIVLVDIFITQHLNIAPNAIVGGKNIHKLFETDQVVR